MINVKLTPFILCSTGRMGNYIFFRNKNKMRDRKDELKLIFVLFIFCWLLSEWGKIGSKRLSADCSYSPAECIQKKISNQQSLYIFTYRKFRKAKTINYAFVIAISNELTHSNWPFLYSPSSSLFLPLFLFHYFHLFPLFLFFFGRYCLLLYFFPYKYIML